MQAEQASVAGNGKRRLEPLQLGHAAVAKLRLRKPANVKAAGREPKLVTYLWLIRAGYYRTKAALYWIDRTLSGYIKRR